MAERADDAQVYELVCEYLDRLEIEGPAVLRELAERHPLLAERVLARLRVLHGAGLLEVPSAAGPDAWPERLGDFRLERRIASGGMGVVFEAWQLSVGRRVALKLVRPELIFFPGARERFRREVDAVARLSDPGIVAVHAVGEEQGLPFLAMEFVDGPSLAEVLERVHGGDPATLRGADLLALLRRGGGSPDSESGSASRRLSGSWVEALVALIADVARSIEHAHRRGVLHRDLKPSNILVTPAGRAVVVDFGLANVTGTGRLTRTGSQMGSLPYMAPEALRGEARELGAAADVYGLGATLYELVTLRLPYAGDTAVALERAQRAGPPPSARRANPSVPSDLDTILAKCLEYEPTRRYASADALAEDLRRVLEHRPVLARRVGLLGRARRFARRRPGAATACALGLVIAVGAPLAALGLGGALRRESARSAAAQGLAGGHLDLALRAAELLLERGGEAPLRELAGALEAALDAQGKLGAGVAEEEHLAYTARLRSVVGRAWAQLGHRVRAGEVRLAQVAELRARVDLAGPPSPWGMLLLEALIAGSEDLLAGGDLAQALEVLEEASRVTEWLEASSVFALAAHERRAAFESDRAQILGRMGRLEEARGAYERALAALDASPEELGERDAAELELEASILSGLGVLLVMERRYEDALEPLSRARDLLESALRRDPLSTDAAYTRALVATDLGNALFQSGRADEAEAELVIAAQHFAALARAHPEIPELRLRELETAAIRASVARARGELEAAREGLGRALARSEELVSAYPEERAFRVSAVVTCMNAGALEVGSERHRAALELYEKADAHLAGLAAFGELEPNDVERFCLIPLALASAHVALDEPAPVPGLLERVAAFGPRRGDTWHELARAWARAGSTWADLADSTGRSWRIVACETLRQAFERGWSDPTQLEAHADWDALRGEPEFAALLASARRIGAR